MAANLKLVDAAGLDAKKMLDRLYRIDQFIRQLTVGDQNAMETLVALGAAWKGMKKRQVDPECLRAMEEVSDKLADVYVEHLRDRK